MLASRWFYRTRTSRTSVHRAPGKEREGSGVNLPDETEIKQKNASVERMEMDVHYLATSARLAEPVAWFELRCRPPADFCFVLTALCASAIVGTLRREKRDHVRLDRSIQVAGAAMDLVRRNDSLYLGGILNVHYLALIARMAEPVAWFELRCPPPVDFCFVLTALCASAIVGTLRREKRDHVRLDRSIQVAGAAMDLVRRNDILYLGRGLNVHYLVIIARWAEPVAWFKLRCPPRANFCFVLTALGASAIVGTLRRVQSLRVRRRH